MHGWDVCLDRQGTTRLVNQQYVWLRIYSVLISDSSLLDSFLSASAGEHVDLYIKSRYTPQKGYMEHDKVETELLGTLPN